MSLSGKPPLSEELQALEELIFQSKDYVVPSEDMKPQLLETAGEHARLWKFAKGAGIASLGVVLCWAVLIPASRYLSGYRQHVTAPSSQEVQQMAQDRYSSYPDDDDWSLVETFQEIHSLDAKETGPVEAIGVGNISPLK